MVDVLNQVVDINLDFIDNPLLEKEISDLYDYDLCKKEVEQIIKNFLKYHFDYLNIEPPKITASYELHYESFVQRKTDSIGVYVEKKLDSLSEIDSFYTNLKLVWGRMSYNERIYITEVLIRKKSENYALDIMKTSRYYLEDIKVSCIIRIANAFGVAKEKQ